MEIRSYHVAGKFELWLARLFGQRFCGIDGSTRVDMIAWHGKVYVVGRCLLRKDQEAHDGE